MLLQNITSLNLKVG